MEALHVFREFAGAYELVGMLERMDARAAPRFAYDAGYLNLMADALQRESCDPFGGMFIFPLYENPSAL